MYINRCGVCSRDVGNISIQCTNCRKLVQGKFGIKGSMYKVMKTFVRKGCMNPVTRTGRTTSHKCRYWCQCKSGDSG